MKLPYMTEGRAPLPESIFKRMVESAPGAMILVNKEGNMIFANAETERLFGYKQDELCGNNVEILIPAKFKKTHPALRDAFFEVPELRAMGARTGLFARRKDGTEFPVEIGLNPMEPADLHLVIASIVDITERKKTEEQQSVFAAIINFSHDAILSKTVTGQITSWNHGAEQVFGYSRVEIIGKNISILIPAQHKNEEAEILKRIVRGEIVEDYETERIRKDGKIIQVTLTISPIKNEMGVVIGASKISRDITTRKEHEAQAQRAMELALTNKELAIQNTEKEKRAAELIIANKELAFQNSEKEKRALELVIANKELVFQNAEKEKRAAELIIANKELAFQNAEKEKRALELVIANKELIVQNTEKEKRALELVIANKELAFQSAEKGKRASELVIANNELIIQNAEKEKHAKELTAANAELVKTEEQLVSVNHELEAFSYSVSHDLRAPLRAIHGYTQILKEDYGEQLNEEANRVMTNIMKSAQKMGALVDDLLAFSRLGRKEIQEQKINMDSMVHEVCAELQNEQPGRIIEFDIKPLLAARADNPTIKQVWLNLIGNAVKYTGHREKAIIQIGSELKGTEITYYVKDNGAGFDMKYIDKLFGVFQRLHSEEEFEGNGVGLAIVQRVTLKHKGRVWAEGKVNEGATFYFTLNK